MSALLLAIFALRIISLAPSLTEGLYAIGAGPDIVAVDAASNRPAAARALPRVGIMSGISAERVLSLRPDVVVGIPYQAPILSQLRRLHVRTAVFEDVSLEDALRTLTRLGALSGRAGAARAYVRGVRASLAASRARAARLGRIDGVAVIGTPPIYAAGSGTFIGDLMDYAAIDNAAADMRVPWPAMSAERILQRQPAALVVPADFTIPPRAPWTGLRAVKRGCVIRVAADDLLRPGPNVARALRQMVDERVRLGGRCRG